MANLLGLVSYKVFPSHMGGQKAVVGFYNQLADHHNIQLAVSVDNEPTTVKYRLHRILHTHRKMGRNVCQLFELKQLCKHYKIDCIIVEHSYTGWIAYLLKMVTGIPFIIRSHNIETSRFRQLNRNYWKIYLRYEKWIHKKADHSFFISEEDKNTAIQLFELAEKACTVIPYGVKHPRVIANAKDIFSRRFRIETSAILYFNGTLDYLPNRNAVVNLIEKVEPLLQARGVDFTIVISGKNLQKEIGKRLQTSSAIRYIGFVDDTSLLYQAASVFLNPVINNSGVKTKIVEALANGCTVVSMQAGAAGIPLDLCGAKIFLAQNDNWEDFVDKIVAALRSKNKETPKAFFEYFSAENCACKASERINFLTHGGSW